MFSKIFFLYFDEKSMLILKKLKKIKHNFKTH